MLDCNVFSINYLFDPDVCCPNRVAVRPQTHSATGTHSPPGERNIKAAKLLLQTGTHTDQLLQQQFPVTTHPLTAGMRLGMRNMSVLSNMTLNCTLLSRFRSPNRAEVTAVRGEVCVLSIEVIDCDNVPAQLSGDPQSPVEEKLCY